MICGTSDCPNYKDSEKPMEYLGTKPGFHWYGCPGCGLCVVIPDDESEDES